MAIRPITVHGEPVLHRRAADVEVIDDEIRTLVQDMYETQVAARGVGLAAPQVGVGLRIFTWTYGGDTGAAPSTTWRSTSGAESSRTRAWMCWPTAATRASSTSTPTVPNLSRAARKSR